MAKLLEYKCPSCGGALKFDSSVQKMKCPYCGTEFEMEALKNYDDVLNQEQPDAMNWETQAGSRSEERRVGKECRSGREKDNEKKKQKMDRRYETGDENMPRKK